MDLTPLHQALRRRRQELGLTMDDVADRASRLSDRVFERYQIHRLEARGAHLPDPEVLRPVASVLELEMCDLLQLIGYLD